MAEAAVNVEVAEPCSNPAMGAVAGCQACSTVDCIVVVVVVA